jgi:class 3 adenylate cyclase
MQNKICHFSLNYKDPLQMRIGIHTGPVEAGVIGTKKFAYDLWGDTVNTANRMESYGVPGKIQVTMETYERLKHKYLLEKRHLITVKGKGEMKTYFLLGRQE